MHMASGDLFAMICLRLLVDPVKLGRLVGNQVALGEPQRNLLLCILHGVRTVAYVATQILERFPSVLHSDQLWVV